MNKKFYSTFFFYAREPRGNVLKINKIHFWSCLIKFYKKLYKIIFLFFTNNDLNFFFFNYIKIMLSKLDFNFLKLKKKKIISFSGLNKKFYSIFFFYAREPRGNVLKINKIHFWSCLIKFYKKLYKIIFLFFTNNDLNFFFFNYIKIMLSKLDFNFLKLKKKDNIFFWIE